MKRSGDFLTKDLKPIRLICFCAVIFLIIARLCIAGEDGAVTIALWGDSRENLDGACEEIVSILLDEMPGWDFMIHTGDFTHDGSEKSWRRSLAYKGMERLFVPGKFFMCTSNHDDNRATWDKFTRGVLPTNSEDNTTHFYSYHMGNVHVVFLDFHFSNPMKVGRWLDEYLEKNVSKDDWLIGVWHEPSYDGMTYKDGSLVIVRPWLESLHRYGGDFVVNGHAHVYVRSKPLLPDGTVDWEKGMVHIVNGVGGAEWKNPVAPHRMIAFTPDMRSFPAITFITLEKDSATVRTIDARPGGNRAVIDEWTWMKTHKTEMWIEVKERYKD